MSILSESESLPQAQKLFGGRLRHLLQEQLRQGLDLRCMAQAIALGFTIGVIPSIWGASLLCVVLARCFGLNQLLVQLTNYLVYPLQILLFVPYFKLGSVLFPLSLNGQNLSKIFSMFRSTPQKALEQFWLVNLQAIAAWLLTTPLLLSASFLLGLVLIQKYSAPIRQ